MHETHEGLRKALHIAFGVCAFGLRWLPWPVAAAVAALAIVGNWLLLHRVVGARVARHGRGFDSGIILYPLSVLVLIVVFRHQIEVAGCAWAILAFGDGFATLAGQRIRGPRLPWNRAKTWSGFVAFLAFGYAGAEVVYLALRTTVPAFSPIVILAATTLAAAIAESLPLHVDDNAIVPAVAAAVMWVGINAEPLFRLQLDWPWIAVNTALAVTGFAFRSVDVSGMVVGWILGVVLIVFGGWPLYAVLLAFFVIGTAMTKIGYRQKAGRGLAQEKGGRRGASHAFANVGMSAMLAVAACLLPGFATAIWCAAAAALATATADTTASELGQLLGRRAFLPLTLRRVAVGTEGAVSVEGTLCGLVAGFIVAMIASWARFGLIDGRIVILLTIAAFAGSWIESLAGNWNRAHGSAIPNGALNFFNTAVGAAVFLVLARFL